ALDNEDDDQIAGSHRMASVTPEADLNQCSSFCIALGSVSFIPSGAHTSAYLDTPYQDDKDSYNPYHDHIAPAGSIESHVCNQYPLYSMRGSVEISLNNTLMIIITVCISSSN